MTGTIAHNAVPSGREKGALPVAEIEGLAIAFPGPNGPVRVVDGVSLAIRRGEAVGLVGESGSGKSITALALLGLLPMAGAQLAGGTIRLNGQDVTGLSDREWRRHRGQTVAMIFQDPLMSLNPVYSVGDQIAEVLVWHKNFSRRAAFERAVEMLDAVGIPNPRARANAYPHELSGGMRQRVMIATALAGEPDLLIADEPTTALDVTIQAQILDLIDRLKDETGAAVLFISHDLGVVSQIADRVAVMYAGTLVEEAPAAEIFAAPEHPYTIGLMGSLPDLGRADEALVGIPGTVPRPGMAPPGCRFAPRCPFEIEACHAPQPLRAIRPAHHAACVRAPIAP